MILRKKQKGIARCSEVSCEPCFPPKLGSLDKETWTALAFALSMLVKNQGGMVHIKHLNVLLRCFGESVNLVDFTGILNQFGCTGMDYGHVDVDKREDMLIRPFDANFVTPETKSVNTLYELANTLVLDEPHRTNLMFAVNQLKANGYS